MHLEHIELSKLVISPANMRVKHKKRDFADLIPSVRARGVLVPLLVRPNGEPDKYEIVAGRRRFLAASAVAEAGSAPTTVPCAIMEPGDDAAALEASLIENLARLDADEVTQWETFVRLMKEGRGVEDIAATFGLDERVVRRVLALGNLHPRIRALYRTEQIDVATVRHLTMATSAQQREWLALYDSNDSYAPTGRVLKEWLFGGSAIKTSVALFDLAEYTAPIIADLFDEHSNFADTALFWSLQTKAIEAKREAYQADGWEDVVVLEPGQFFESWKYEKRARTKGGRVYIVVSGQGEVEAREGFIPRGEAEKRDTSDGASPAPPRPELTAPLRRYVDLHRHAVVRARLLGHPSVALRMLLAHVISGSPLWSVRCETQRADKPETEQSVHASRAQAAFDQGRAAALEKLGLDRDGSSLVGARAIPSLDILFEALTNLTDEEVISLLPIVMGETLEAGSEAVDVIGSRLMIDPGELWAADEAFFALLRDRKALSAMLDEVAGPEVAQGNSDATGKVLKAILRDCLDGLNGRSKVEGWVPRWMRFPAASYLDPEAPAELAVTSETGVSDATSETVDQAEPQTTELSD